MYVLPTHNIALEKLVHFNKKMKQSFAQFWSVCGFFFFFFFFFLLFPSFRFLSYVQWASFPKHRSAIRTEIFLTIHGGFETWLGDKVLPRSLIGIFLILTTMVLIFEKKIKNRRSAFFVMTSFLQGQGQIFRFSWDTR